ncbi:hypothetical protein EV2_015429 [Malus domestica]
MPSRGRSCMMAFIWMRSQLMVPPYLKPNDVAWNLWNSKEHQNSLQEKLYQVDVRFATYEGESAKVKNNG